MTALKACYQALKGLGITIIPDLQTGKESEYITYNYADDRGGDFGDEEPYGNLVSVQVHYCCDLSRPYTAVKRTIRRALDGAGFTYPSVTEQNTEIRRHLIFECEYFEEE